MRSADDTTVSRWDPDPITTSTRSFLVTPARTSGHHHSRQRIPPCCAGCNDGGMILEHALLSVKPGQESEFERAFGDAKAIISARPGFRRLVLSRCLERTSTYLLLIE